MIIVTTLKSFKQENSKIKFAFKKACRLKCLGNGLKAGSKNVGSHTSHCSFSEAVRGGRKPGGTL